MPSSAASTASGRSEEGKPSKNDVTAQVVEVEPFEIEEGKADPSLAAPTTTTKPAKTLDAGGKQTTCQRHPRKYICLGVTLSLGLVLGILAAIYYPRMPTFTLFEQSIVEIDGLTGAQANLVIKIDNPNRYPISFQNMRSDVYSYDGSFIGTVTRPERFMVGPRSSGLMSAKGDFRTNLLEVAKMGIDCLANDLQTQVQIKSTVDVRLSKKTIAYKTSTTEKIPCSAQNVNGGGGDGDGASVVNQIGNEINQRINDAFGGGGGGAARKPAAGGGAAPAPGATVPKAPDGEGQQ